MALVTKSFSDIITFTRTSNATQFNSAGTLVYAPHNIVTWSEDFTNAAWVKTNATISGNATTAPNNTLTADRIGIVDDNFTAEVTQTITVIDNITIIFSCYLKYSGEGFNNSVYLSARTKANVLLFSKVINLSTGILSGTGSAETSTSVTDVGSGWYRLVFTVNSIGTGATTPTVGIYADPNPFIGDNFVFAWGAQLNVVALQSYNQTTSSAYYGPRLDYNPSTLAAQGLLIEEARTNSIRNNTMQGAVAGTPGTLPTNWAIGGTTTGLTISVVGTGTESGITYIDIRFNGTAGAALNPNILFDTSTGIAAANGQTWAWSSYVSLVGGSLTNVTSIIAVQSMFSSTPTLLGTLSGSPFVPTGAALNTQRQTFVGTLNQATTAFVRPQLQFSVANGAAIDITLRIGLPQLEQGAFATSVIPTTTTALTRSADVASVNTLSPWFNATEGTLYAEVQAASGFNVAGSFGRFAGIQDALNNNSVEIFFDGNANLAPRYRVRSGGVNQAIGSSATAYTANTTLKSALAYKVNDFAGVSRGVVDLTDTSGVVPVGPTVLSLGSEGGAINYLNGWLRRVTYYPRRLSNAELQAITA